MQMTKMLRRLGSGDEGASEAVIPLVYNELKKLARSHLRREFQSASLETTTLVHEAFLRLSGGRHPWYESRSHFYGIASRLMRQVLVDAARSRAASKRGAGLEIPMAKLPEWAPESNRTVLAMNDALDRLQGTDPVKSQLIEMRFFGGLTAEESAEALAMPVHAVRRELRLALAWMRRELSVQEAVDVAA